MRTLRVTTAAGCLLAAVLAQTGLLPRLGLPGGGPNLVLLVVVALGLLAGRGPALVAGFTAGLALDLLGAHAAGLLALVYGLAGYAAGTLSEWAERSRPAVVTVVLGAAAAAPVAYAGMAALSGDPRATWSGLVGVVPASLLYALLAFPFVVPVVLTGGRWLGAGPARR